MKTVSLALVATGTLMVAGCTPGSGGRPDSRSNDPLILRTHFVGTEQLFSSDDAAKLKEIWGLKSSADLRRQTLDRLARLPVRALGSAVPAGAPDQANLIRPLLDDLLTHESYVEFRATPEFLIAVKLPASRARVWQNNLSQAVSNWKLGTPAPIDTDGMTGWELKRKPVPSQLSVKHLRDWLVVSAGASSLALESNVLSAIRASGRPAKPTGAWLDGGANLARFDTWLPVLGKYGNVPLAHFSLSNRADFVRTFVTLDFPKAHGWKSEEWHIPTNRIFDPLAVFTAVRGIAPLLEALKPVQELGYKPTPNQVVGWGNHGLPFQLFYAAPSRDVTGQLKRLEPKLSSMLVSKGGTNLVGSLAWDTNRSDLYWRGMPLAAPQLGSYQEGGTEFLEFRLFPIAQTKRRPPAEMFAQLQRPNLVYYDWEITDYRMPHWRQTYQMAEIATRRAFTSSNAPSQRWISDLTPKLGESVTEIISTSPTQMTLTRKSHAGLTAFELITLSRWLESTNFPALGIFPPQPQRPTRPARTPARAR